MRVPIANASSSAGIRTSVSEIRRFSSFFASRAILAGTCFLLTGLLAFGDYLTGYEQTFLLFYLLPISLATWFGSRGLGLFFSVLSLAAWVTSDLAAGSPTIDAWNVGMAMAAYAVFCGLLAKLRTLLGELDQRVRDRTTALRKEIAERKRLDREVAEVADRERRRLGQDLHDGLCQHLTGTALTAQALREKLAAKSSPEVAEADKVVRHIEEGIDLSRNLARGFFSPELEAEGLMVALQSLAENTGERFQIACTFDTDELVRVHDSAVATQLYRIAQEAVMNAVKHANAQEIGIRVVRGDGSVTLTISDDGIGFPENLPQPEGLGLRLMSHGADLIGAKFNVRRNAGRGTVVTCKVETPDELGQLTNESKTFS